jgi:tRNA U34 5-carboxymethylaminomethyl modifying GTPase MnmE/TrmE
MRISGPECLQVMDIISGLKVSPPPRTAVLRKLRHPESGKTIDRGLVLYFPSNLVIYY